MIVLPGSMFYVSKITHLIAIFSMPLYDDQHPGILTDYLVAGDMFIILSMLTHHNKRKLKYPSFLILSNGNKFGWVSWNTQVFMKLT